MAKKTRSEARLRRHQRVRKVISGTTDRPRLNVFRSLAEIYVQVIDDQAAWARMNGEQYGADMVTVHLLSTDPLIQDRSPREASKRSKMYCRRWMSRSSSADAEIRLRMQRLFGR